MTLPFNAKTLTQAIQMGIGAASMCWEPIPTGVFDTQNAKQVCDEVLKSAPKYLEVRDDNTCIPVYAFKLDKTAMTWSLGYNPAIDYIVVVKLATGDIHDQPSSWFDPYMQHVHHTITVQWDTLIDGQVLDMRVVRGEQEKPVESQYNR